MAFTLPLLAFLLLVSGAATSFVPVVDFVGEELQQGKRYYIVSPDASFFLGVQAINNSCPLFVVPDYAISPKLAHDVTFLTEGQNDDIIREGTTLNIISRFSPNHPPSCADISTVWTLDRDLVRTGGAASNGTSGRSNSRFSIYRVEGADVPTYRIQSCQCKQTVEPGISCRLPCLGVGLVKVGAKTLVGVSREKRLAVVFVDSNEGSIIRSVAATGPRF